MSKKSRIKHTQKKKHAKKTVNMSRRQAKMSLELAAAREMLNREVPLMDQLMTDVRTFMRHVLSMEATLKRTVMHIETGAYIDTPLMTRDEYIMALNAELKKIQHYKTTILNPLVKKMVETYELKDNAERLLGEAEMQVALDEAYHVFASMAEDVTNNTGKLNLQKSLQIKNPLPGAEAASTADEMGPIVMDVQATTEPLVEQQLAQDAVPMESAPKE